MNSRDKILNNVLRNQPIGTQLPDIGFFERNAEGAVKQFAEVLTAIGGVIYYVNDYHEIENIVKEKYTANSRKITFIPELAGDEIALYQENNDQLELADVELAVLKAHFGVAENGAVWITDEQMGNRVLPFICQHLAIVINETAIVPTMHDAYPIIGKQQYNFGSFIAGPSKTADIEQSLVLGAHGPRSMAIFILLNHNDQH